LENLWLAGREQLLAGEFRRGAQIERLLLPRGRVQRGGEGVQMRLVAGRDRQRRGLHLNEIPRRKPGAQRLQDPRASPQQSAAIGVAFGGPPGGSGHRHNAALNGPEMLAFREQMSMVRPEIAGPFGSTPFSLRTTTRESHRQLAPQGQYHRY